MIPDPNQPTQSEIKAVEKTLQQPPPLGNVNHITIAFLLLLGVTLWCISYVGTLFGWWGSTQEGKDSVLGKLNERHSTLLSPDEINNTPV
jgi:hypothetical protein